MGVLQMMPYMKYHHSPIKKPAEAGFLNDRRISKCQANRVGRCIVNVICNGRSRQWQSCHCRCLPIQNSTHRAGCSVAIIQRGIELLGIFTQQRCRTKNISTSHACDRYIRPGIASNAHTSTFNIGRVIIWVSYYRRAWREVGHTNMLPKKRRFIGSRY